MFSIVIIVEKEVDKENFIDFDKKDLFSVSLFFDRRANSFSISNIILSFVIISKYNTKFGFRLDLRYI